MGCRTESAAVHIAHVLQRLHFFQFFKFCLLTAKKKLHALTAKKKIQFFLIIHTTYRKKKLHAFTAKKKYTTRQFFFLHDLHFSHGTPKAYKHDKPISNKMACQVWEIHDPFALFVSSVHIVRPLR